MPFYKQSIEAFKNMKEYQVILSIGKYHKVEELGELPDNIFAYNYVPQLQVLKQTDVFITHGGINSINEALFLFKLPLIIIPQDSEQFDNSLLVEKFNAGIYLKEDNLTPEILKDSVIKFLENKNGYIKGIDSIVDSFNEARKDRKKIYERIFD